MSERSINKIFEPLGLHSCVVESEQEAQDAMLEAKSMGLMWAATSNAGLPKGKLRLTFVPMSAYEPATK